jgi:hypothetical protein
MSIGYALQRPLHCLGIEAQPKVGSTVSELEYVVNVPAFADSVLKSKLGKAVHLIAPQHAVHLYLLRFRIGRAYDRNFFVYWLYHMAP